MHDRTATDYAALVGHYEELMHSFDWPDGLVALVVPKVSAWSAAQQIEHVAKSKRAILAQLTRLFRDGWTDNRDKRPTALGRAILLAGYIPRGAGKSPDRFAAATEVDVVQIKELASSALNDLRGIESELPAIAESAARFPHPRFGHLGGREWVRFMRIHTWHHLKIVRDIRRHLDVRPNARS